MTYILTSSLLLLLCWLIFGQKYFLYILACLPTGIFIFTGNYWYASIMALLMFFFINTNSPKTITTKHNKFKALILAISISSLPIAAYFSSRTVARSEDTRGIFLSIILGLLVVFVAASSSIGAGINRTKGDKDIHE